MQRESERKISVTVSKSFPAKQNYFVGHDLCSFKFSVTATQEHDQYKQQRGNLMKYPFHFLRNDREASNKIKNVT